MEGTKKCPYCGEEILSVAKKCKYCGEWLVNQQQIVRKKSYFDPRYLYDKVWMDVLFWVTIVGSFIQAVHQSGLTVRKSTISYLIFINWAGKIPEAVGDFLFVVGNICFIILLMKVFSYLHKPLKGWFITYIIVEVIIAFLSPLSDYHLNDEVRVILGLIVLASIVPLLLLPIMIVYNYGGSIKTLGWVMIGNAIAQITVGLVADYIVPIAGFLLVFLIDLFFYIYLRNILTQSK